MSHAQIRRYVYCDVVRACDMSPHLDISGVQVCAAALIRLLCVVPLYELLDDVVDVASKARLCT
jgi:hypothetical protein